MDSLLAAARKRTSKFSAAVLSLNILLGSFAGIVPVFTPVAFAAALSIETATGGDAIDSSTAGGTYTTLTKPKIKEGAAGEIGLGTIILNVPTGFEFDTGGTAPTIRLSGASGTASCNINDTANNTDMAVTSVTATQITFTVTAVSTSGGGCIANNDNDLTWQDVRVRPTASAPLATGNLTVSGTSSISGVTGATNFGTLTEVGVTITPATGGSAISASTVGGTYTDLTGPVIQENAAGDIGENGAGTIILNAPAGFIFDVGGTAPTVLMNRVTGTGTDSCNINDAADGTSLAITSRTTTAITFTVTHKSTDGGACTSITNKLTWQGIRVRPTAALPLASGNIVKTGASVIVGIENSVTNLGTLTEIGLDTTSTGLLSSLNPSTFGTNVTFTATVTGGATPTGTVDLLDGVTVIDTQALVSGEATFNISSLSVGTHSLTAVYAGDGTHSGSTSTPVLLQVVDTALTSTVLVSDLNPSTFNANVTFTATVSGGVSPTGTVDLVEDGVTVIDTQALVAGEATFAISTLSVGTHSLTAVYSGDSNNATSTSTPALSQVVNKAVTTTALVSSLNPSIDTDTVTFTATVTGETPTGTVVFKDNGSVIGSSSVDGFGVATYDALGLTLVGSGATHPITAEYQGDANNDVSTSNTVSQVVNTLPQLTVIKYVVNDNSGSYIVTDFTLYIDASPVTSGIENSVAVGAHVVSEAPDSQYEGTFTSGDCDSSGNITLALNEEKTCVITNDDKPAHLIVIKNVINDNGGTKVASEFTMNVSGNSPDQTSFPGSDIGVDVTLNAGSYDVTEPADSQYATSYSADCSGVILPGETKTCTITNDDIQPLVTLTKVVINDDNGTKGPGDFDLFVGSNYVVTGVQTGVDAGTYLITETPDSEYTARFDGDCTVDGAITLVPGGVYSCTVTNHDLPPASTDDDEGNEASNGSARGSGTARLQAVADFVANNIFGSIAPGAFGGGPNVPLSPSEIGVVCAMQNALPDDASNSLKEWLAEYLASLLNRSTSVIADALDDASLCETAPASPEAKADEPIAMQVDAAGFPVSSNETWNKCIAGRATLRDLRNNPDKDKDGLARDCSDYHTAKVWYHPDLQIFFSFDKKNKVVSVPTGYFVQKDQAVSLSQ